MMMLRLPTLPYSGLTRKTLKAVSSKCPLLRGRYQREVSAGAEVVAAVVDLEVVEAEEVVVVVVEAEMVETQNSGPEIGTVQAKTVATITSRGGMSATAARLLVPVVMEALVVVAEEASEEAVEETGEAEGALEGVVAEGDSEEVVGVGDQTEEGIGEIAGIVLTKHSSSTLPGISHYLMDSHLYAAVLSKNL